MKKGLWLMLAAVSLAAVVRAADNNPNIGCGWGSRWFGDKDTKIPLLLGATTNGTYTQTFGISSETAGCTAKGGWVKNDKKAEAYAEINLRKLSREMAQGGGEYLGAFASLMGCQDESTRQAFFKLTQQKYESIFTMANIDSTAMLQNLRTAMAADPKLATL